MRRIAWTSFVAAVVLSVLPASAQQVTIDSLLTEMIDRHALSKFPDPYYTCKQFSSYDRASTSPDNEETWFANGDAG